ncbi:MAG: Nif11-like leader peptide family RiPP precursor [Planctomycetaceae bacterium]|jgi:predicted ribosomally synthesized peptide with nif11-like leader|nr:Nif11-like leader peptide family RiPP precursor [Planctomycetaceae bacterium]
MSVQNALNFIEKVRTNRLFRKEAYHCGSSGEYRQWIADSGFDFRSHEIWDAFRSLLLKAGDESEADEIKELRMWYRLLSCEEERNVPLKCQTCTVKGNCHEECSQ